MSGSGRAIYDFEKGISPVYKIGGNEPYVAVGVHNVGRIGLTISNQGHFGTGFISGASDPFGGGDAPSCTYPYPGQLSYLFAGAFWIGAVVGRDTLVSVGADGWHGTRELWPDPAPRGEVIYHSILNDDDEEAVSEQDFIAMYTDTLTNTQYVEIDPIDGRPHIPLGIEVTQRSYAWSYSYAEDFVLFDYSIKNIGYKELKKVYMGIYVDGDVTVSEGGQGYDDDICGFRRDLDSPFGCGFKDTINIAWIADNDGSSIGGMCPYDNYALTSVTGTRVVRTPSDSLKYSFNWWISNGAASQDFGPRMAGTPDDPFRDFGGFLGTPEGDRNKYYIMRHEEFDYDQLFSAVNHTSEGWLPGGTDSYLFARGFDTRYLLSFGPFDISPGEVLPISFAYVAGENFHTNCEAFEEIFDPLNPGPYYNQLSFTDIGRNAMWASWIYDNPGVDTDGNDDSGKYRICVYDSLILFDTLDYDPLVIETTVVYLESDTVFYEGDGVPDFRGASPPPPPELWVIDTTGDTLYSRIHPRLTEFHTGEFRIRWNGLRSETTRDYFTNLVDFEGYRVYVSLSPQPTDFVLYASYDVEDYNKYIWNSRRRLWELKDVPFSIDSLTILYGDDGVFYPLNYSLESPLYWYDSTFYFTAQDWNASGYLDTNQIYKIYPDQEPPTTLNLDTARIHYPEELTEEGFFKYYEYGFNVKNLLPSRLYQVAVTAFDYGSPSSGLPSLEIPPARNSIAEYALNSGQEVERGGLNVIVYPNPYRLDADYLDLGFEGRDYIDSAFGGQVVIQEGLNEQRTRSIHFINLPHKCTIRIFSIDGDLVREIDHDFPEGSPRSMHARWDLITRNTQAVVSGIYYFTVESEYGNQMGKIVIIL
nr:hypothetical protein [candidate division Zixibacteria bacterium]